MTDRFGPPERRECIDCGLVRTLEFFTAHEEICDDCMTEADDLMAAAEIENLEHQLATDRMLYGSSFERVDRDGKRQRVDPMRILVKDSDDIEQDWGGDHIADTNRERGL